jgi:hypothetical protein
VIARTRRESTEGEEALAKLVRLRTQDGQSFLLAPGDVLLAEDTAGGGHRWALVDDQPWCRVSVEL